MPFIKNTVFPIDYDWDWEPDEVRHLKQQLANLKCQCESCQKKRPHESSKSVQYLVDQAVQAEENFLLDYLHQFTAKSVKTFSDDNMRSNLINQIRKEVLCPSCFIALSMFHGIPKVVRDEASEMNTQATCDKATERSINVIERSTLAVIKPKVGFSDLTLNNSPSVTPEETASYSGSSKASHSSDELVNRDKPDTSREVKTHSTCTCLEHFIDSIRPPLFS